jgi:hypothetical protein
MGFSCPLDFLVRILQNPIRKRRHRYKVAWNEHRLGLTIHSTFFQSVETWPMRDNADPHHGWSVEEVAQMSSGPATADLYGKLFFYLRATLRQFVARLSVSQVSFRLYCVDVLELPGYLDNESYNRIEVS